MTDSYIQVPNTRYGEGSSFTATAYFRVGSSASAPTTAQYRVDCLTTSKTLTDWTDLTPAESIAITITQTHNAIQNQNNSRELKQITIQANQGTNTQTRSKAVWLVLNNEAF